MTLGGFWLSSRRFRLSVMVSYPQGVGVSYPQVFKAFYFVIS